MRSKNTTHQNCKRDKKVWLIVRQSPMKASWWDAPLAPLSLRVATSDREQFSDPPPFIWTPHLLIFRLSVGPPLLFSKTPPIIWNWRVDFWFLWRITRCNFMRNLVNTKISTIKACHDLTLQPLDPPSLCSSFHLTYWNLK